MAPSYDKFVVNSTSRGWSVVVLVVIIRHVDCRSCCLCCLSSLHLWPFLSFSSCADICHLVLDLCIFLRRHLVCCSSLPVGPGSLKRRCSAFLSPACPSLDFIAQLFSQDRTFLWPFRDAVWINGPRLCQCRVWAKCGSNPKTVVVQKVHVSFFFGFLV